MKPDPFYRPTHRPCAVCAEAPRLPGRNHCGHPDCAELAPRPLLGTYEDGALPDIPGAPPHVVPSDPQPVDKVEKPKKIRPVATPKARPAPEPKPPRANAVLTHAHLLGKVPDRDVATLAGCTQDHVSRTRERLGIPRFAANSERLAPFRHLLGTMSDRELAGIAGVIADAVLRERRRLGIAAVAHPTVPRPRGPTAKGWIALLGTMPDREIARRCGVSRSTLTKHRQRNPTAPPAVRPVPVCLFGCGAGDRVCGTWRARVTRLGFDAGTITDADVPAIRDAWDRHVAALPEWRRPRMVA